MAQDFVVDGGGGTPSMKVLVELLHHRVTGFKDGCCLIRGDNMAEPDGLIPRANIRGYVTCVERDGKEIWWWGLGPERYLIALVSQRDLLHLAVQDRADSSL